MGLIPFSFFTTCLSSNLISDSAPSPVNRNSVAGRRAVSSLVKTPVFCALRMTANSLLSVTSPSSPLRGPTLILLLVLLFM